MAGRADVSLSCPRKLFPQVGRCACFPSSSSEGAVVGPTVAQGYRARKEWPRLRLRWRARNYYAIDIQRWVRYGGCDLSREGMCGEAAMCDERWAGVYMCIGAR